MGAWISVENIPESVMVMIRGYIAEKGALAEDPSGKSTRRRLIRQCDTVDQL